MSALKPPCLLSNEREVDKDTFDIAYNVAHWDFKKGELLAYFSTSDYQRVVTCNCPMPVSRMMMYVWKRHPDGLSRYANICEKHLNMFLANEERMLLRKQVELLNKLVEYTKILVVQHDRKEVEEFAKDLENIAKPALKKTES
jgi:hypothetical protein